MPRVRILIEEADVELLAELNESSTARALWDALPLASAAQTWGEEVYFSVPLSCPSTTRRRQYPPARWATGRRAGPSVYSSASSP